MEIIKKNIEEYKKIRTKNKEETSKRRKREGRKKPKGKQKLKAEIIKLKISDGKEMERHKDIHL